MRGLKLDPLNEEINTDSVAPSGGAWIETLTPDVKVRRDIVAPLGGAWIETWQKL